MAFKFCGRLDSSFWLTLLCCTVTQPELAQLNVDREKYLHSTLTWTPARGKGKREGLSPTSWSKLRILIIAFTRSVSVLVIRLTFEFGESAYFG